MSPALKRIETSPHASKKPPREEDQRPAFPTPKLRLECRDLDHAGAAVFFTHENPAKALSNAVSIVLSTLYTPGAPVPGTRSVTLILRSMPGVAYTTGTDLDSDHKEIHFSLDYIHGITSRTPGRETHELQGVLVHEMVHAWQWNARGTAPGGLIEGVADFVRLQAGLDPPHWKREVGGDWDAGYQHTAYFLAWLEERQGRGSVKKLNAGMREEEYGEGLWRDVFGTSVEELWRLYQDSLKDAKDKETDEGGGAQEGRSADGKTDET